MDVHSCARRYLLFLRYCISGVSGIVVQTAALWVWVSELGLRAYYLEGVVFAFLCGVTTAFLLQKYWTFADRQQYHATHHQVLLYLLVALCNLIFSTILSWAAKTLFESLGFDYFHGWYLLAQLGVAGFAALFSFLANYFLTFRETRLDVRSWLGQ